MDDEREEEISTLSSIFPELVIDSSSQYRFTLSLPVDPTEPVRLQDSSMQANGQHPDSAHTAQHVEVKHLPPITLVASLPEGYPAENPPVVQLLTSPPWLDPNKLLELEKECGKLWTEYGQCQILYTYIDSLQQAAERCFDLGSTITVDAALQTALVDFDRMQDKEIFERGSYDCGVCLEPKKGALCHRMTACGHVFCRACLQDFYNSAITEGDITNVTCLEPSCGQNKPGEHRKRKTLHPRELLEVGIAEAQARRYVELRRKKKLESDKSTIYCPRTWCQAPARSNKYPPIPANLLDYVDPDDTADDSDPPPMYTKDTPDRQLPAPADRLVVCSKCALAFCRVCYLGWHGEFARCWPRNPGDLSAEEKASYDYIRLNTTPCPTCASPTQKTRGCNHMNCFQCNTHFCYLCSSWLEPSNPYPHFSNPRLPCNGRLWDGEEGDEDPIGQFEGPRRAEAEAAAVAAAADQEEARLAAERLEAEDALAVVEQQEQRPAPAVQPVHQPPQPPHQQARHVHRPPPGPIDAMHAMVLRLEQARLDAGQAPAVNQPGYDAFVRAMADFEAVAIDRRAGQANGGGRRGRGRDRTAAARQRQAQAQPEGLLVPRHGRRAVQVGGGAGDGWVLPAVGGGGVAAGGGAGEDRRQDAIRRFVALAERDEEDEWDSDELEDDEAFLIADL